MRKTIWRAALLMCLVLGAAFAALNPGAAQRAHAASTWYVSNASAGLANGTSWANAWSFTGISWASVSAGDTILLDGGSTQCTSNYDFSGTRPGVSCGLLYNGTLTIGKSGVSGSPITIKLSSDSGHNGTAVFFGGRSSALPYCTQSGYSATTAGTRFAKGIDATGKTYVTVDGNKRSGIMIYGYDLGNGTFSTGVDTDSSTANDTFRNLEIFDNGIPTSGTPVNSDDPGVRLRGHDLTFDRDLIHDNGQDEFQGAGGTGTPVNNITIENSWMYDHRVNPSYAGYGFNQAPKTVGCQHTDGIQIYAGGQQSGLTFDYDIFGPFLFQGIYPSDIGTYYNNVNITHTLVVGNNNNNVNTDAQSPTTNPNNWKFTNDTLWDTATQLDPNGWTNLNIHTGSSFTYTDSIFANGNGQQGASATGSGNVYWNTVAVPGATNTNPLFTAAPTGSAPTWANYASADFTPGCTGCSTKGSPLHTLSDLTSRIDNLNAPTLQSITVTPANATVTAGNTQQYTATGNYSDGSQADLTSSSTWSTGNTSIATINSSGLLTAVAAGTTTVSAVSSGITGQTNVTVSSASITACSSVTGNTILNCSFETGDASKWTFSTQSPAAGSNAVVSTSAADGTYSDQMTVTTADSANPYKVQLKQTELYLTNGQVANFAFSMKANAARSVQVCLQQNVSPFTVYKCTSYSVTTSYQEFTMSYTPTATDNNVMLGFNVGDVVSTVNVDNVSGTGVGGCLSVSSNTAGNCSFENSTLSPWAFNVTAPAAATQILAADAAYAGQQGEHVTITTADATNLWHVQLMQGNLGFTNGHTVTMSFYGKTDSARSIQVCLQQNYSPFSVYKCTSFSLTTSWAQYSMTYTPTANETNASFAFNMAGSTGTDYLDNVVYQP